MPLYPILNLHALGFEDRPDIPRRVRRWPDRVRCYKCRNFFTFICVDKLYCSYACAGRDAPLPDPTPQGRPGDHVPRQCKLKGGKKFKRRYRSLEAVQEALLDNEEPGLNGYYCDYCNYFHMGHDPLSVRMAEEREARRIASLARREALRAVKEGARRARQAEINKKKAAREHQEEEERRARELELRARAITSRRRLSRRNNGVVAPWATRNS